MILFWKNWTVALGIAILTSPMLEAGGVSQEPSRVRRYEVREDAATGRLTRVTKLVRQSTPASGGSVGATGKTVVQGRDVLDVASLVQDAGLRHDVEPDLIHAVIRQESNYDVFAVSVKGACGLMQLMPGTALRFGVKDIFDPAENVEGGVKYLRFLMDRYDGDRIRTLAAYNAGEGAVDQYGGVPPYRETEDYVDRVRQWYGSLGGVSNETPVETGVKARVDSAGALVFEMR